MERVLMVADGDKVVVGRPTIEGTRVVAEVVDEGKGKKVIVFKYKPKTRYRRKLGHRQPYTRLLVQSIEGLEEEKPPVEALPTTRRRSRRNIEGLEGEHQSEEAVTQPTRRGRRNIEGLEGEHQSEEVVTQPTRRSRRRTDGPQEGS